MSTASRNCGMDGGARAGKGHALSAPGANGKLREHYDSRALRGQLGGSGDGTRPKRMPGTENAAPEGRAQAPSTPTTPELREPRLRQSPPPKPARPPPPEAARTFWPGYAAREEPLARCPDLVCNRARACRWRRGDRPCRRLFQTQDEFLDGLSERLEALARARKPLVFASQAEEDAHAARLYGLLRRMADD